MVDLPVVGPAPRFKFRLPGGRFAVDSFSEFLRAWIAVIVLLGVGRVVLRVASLLMGTRMAGGRALCRGTERLWARLAARLLGVWIRVEGVEHIDPEERYVVASLHEGFADALALYRLPLTLTAVARNEIAELPLLGDHLKRGHHIFLRPELPLEATRALIRGAQTAIEAGNSVLVFPQGSILGIELAFQPGAFHLAKRLGRPVLPVVVTGGHRVWEHPFSPILRMNQAMSIKVLPPVLPEDAVRQGGEIERCMKQVAMTGEIPPRRFDPSRDGYWDGYRYEIDPAFPELARRVAGHREMRSPGTEAN